MKKIWLNILAFAAFLAIEFAAIHFMGVYGAGSENAAILGMTALIVGGLYTLLLGAEIPQVDA